MRRIAVAVLPLLLCVVSTTFAADKAGDWKPLDVPKEITTKQEIASTPEGWAVTKETRPNALASVTICEGEPSSEYSLVYDDESKVKDTLVLTWKFDPASTDPLYVLCSYSATSVVISKALPKGIKELRVTCDDGVKTDGMPTITKIEYR